MKKYIISRIITVSLAAVFFLFGCAEYHYSQKHHEHSERYNNRHHHHSPSTEVEIEIHK